MISAYPTCILGTPSIGTLTQYFNRASLSPFPDKPRFVSLLGAVIEFLWNSPWLSHCNYRSGQERITAKQGHLITSSVIAKTAGGIAIRGFSDC